MDPTAALVSEITGSIKRWETVYFLWGLLFYVLGVTSVISSVLVASIDATKFPYIVKSCSILTAVSVALLGLLKPLDVSRDYNVAYSDLNAAYLAYLANTASEPSRAKLADSYRSVRHVLAGGTIFQARPLSDTTDKKQPQP